MRVFLAILSSFIFSTALLAETITLSNKNTIVINTPIFGEFIAPVEQELLDLDSKLPPGQPIYLFMDTPGGSISDGMEFIELAKSLNREVKTITKFAASMGFVIVQALGERMILNSGVLMSHRASATIRGNTPGELETHLNFIHSYNKLVDDIIGTRLQMTPEEILAMNIYEYWTMGREATTDEVADTIVDVKCDKSMTGVKWLTFQTMFGPIKIKYSKCPLISTPLGVEMGNIKAENLPDKDKKLLDMIINGTPVTNNTFEFTNTSKRTY